MDLNFKNEENKWVAEFQATSNFNLHIERTGLGSIVVSQRGTDNGEYDTAFIETRYEGQKVFDCDFGALVFPKWIKVISGSEVIKGVVTFSE